MSRAAWGYFSSLLCFYADFVLVRRTNAFLLPSVRWGQPAQQHGRRTPVINSVLVRSTRSARVLGRFASSIQQIHSLRASGVMSSHASCASMTESKAFLRSFGTVWATPSDNFLTMYA